jgi:predicted PurR-regulated permease PerM|tara:strand:- start:909 stop:2255 length:1347 start_codon:yes stop_codon:yes gene_type:complete
MKSFNLPEFIENVPVLRLFGKNLALNAGIAFVIQDFLIPLYSSYIIDIVVGLVIFGILSVSYWFFIFKNKSKNFAHFSFQIAIVCIILSVMVGALSSVSKALSSDDRGILASNVDFVAELQDNTNVYDEELQSLGRDISKVSNQFSELQNDLSTLSEQISSQLTDEGNPLNNDEFLDKISTLIEEKSLTNNITVENVDDTEEVKELKKNLDIATELLRQVTLANVNLQKRDDDVNETLNADSLIYYIGDLKEDMSDLRNFSLQLLANTALADSRSELNTFKDETKKDLDEFKLFTSKEIDEIKELAKEILNSSNKGSGKQDNNFSKELKDLSKAMEKSNSKVSTIDEGYLEEIAETYQELAEKIDNSSVQNDLEEIKKEIANLSSSNQNTSLAPEVLEKLQSAPNGNLDNTAGLSELKYYIVELMKDQNEIRQIVKDLRELLEKGEEN